LAKPLYETTKGEEQENVREVGYVPKITSDKGQERLPRHTVLVELLLKT
jgi:hypothetical protein